MSDERPTREQILKQWAGPLMNAWLARWVLECEKIPDDLHPMMLACMLMQHIAEKGPYRVSLTIGSTIGSDLVRSECRIVDWQQDKEVAEAFSEASFLAVYKAALLWALKR